MVLSPNRNHYTEIQVAYSSLGLCCLYLNASINVQEVRASQLTLWYNAITTDGHGRNRRRMIVAMARKLLVVLWQLATKGLIPEGAMVS